MNTRVSSESKNSVTTRALNCIYEVIKIDEKKDKFGQSYRARARSVPSMVYEIGLLSALSYLYAKATKVVLQNATKIYNSSTGEINEQTLSKQDDEKLAYAIYLKHLTDYIKDKLKLEDELKPQDEPLQLIKVLAETPDRLSIAESLLKPFLIELKHLAEATLKAEEEVA